LDAVHDQRTNSAGPGLGIDRPLHRVLRRNGEGSLVRIDADVGQDARDEVARDAFERLVVDGLILDQAPVCSATGMNPYSPDDPATWLGIMA
jgi:hypothetical protein